MKILIAGIPGMGKSYFGNYLKQHHQYKHKDFEDGLSLNRFALNPDEYLINEANLENVVITWGFVPDLIQTDWVKFIESKGFKLIWFDGNRKAAFKEYTKAGKPKDLFDLQISRIESSNVVKIINPKITNTFDSNGNHRNSEEILDEIVTP